MSHPPSTPGPASLAHWVVKTARRRQMIEWYGHVFGAKVVHQDNQIAFLSWDEESHRWALISIPTLLRYVLPLARFRRKVYGVDHIAFTYGSLSDLLSHWDRLRRIGIKPAWSINHGPTTSLYYEDPDGIRLEFQVENSATSAETAEYFATTQFAANPIGTNIDPGYLLEQSQAGIPDEELVRPDAGTRPGTTPKTNRRTINFRTL